jgi:hypothetical protein
VCCKHLNNTITIQTPIKDPNITSIINTWKGEGQGRAHRHCLQSEGVKILIHTVGGAFVFFERGSSSDEESSLLLLDFLFLGAGFFSAFLFGIFFVLAFFVGAFFAFAVVLPPFFLDFGSYINQKPTC